MLISFFWGLFLVCAFMAFSSYMRITVILRAIDRELEDPPDRPQMNDKLRAYRDWCRETNRFPILLLLFAIGAFGMALCWTPLPWLIYK